MYRCIGKDTLVCVGESARWPSPSLVCRCGVMELAGGRELANDYIGGGEKERKNERFHRKTF